MSILVVAIVPPHLTVLSMRMAVAFYVTGISTSEVHLESPPLLGTLNPCATAVCTAEQVSAPAARFSFAAKS